jgi:RNA polymerase sigma factor (sigma-70 family)
METTMGAARGSWGPIQSRPSGSNERRTGSGLLGPGYEREGRPEADVVGCEVGELYRTFAKHLERVVRSDVQAPAAVIEDACQFAWARLVHHRGRVRRETVFGWLARTAMHEAFKLTRRDGSEVSLEAEIEAGRDTSDHRPGPPDIYERRERLRTVSSLSARPQRLVWLHGLGLTYAEIANKDGCSSRTVERQLQRARATLRAADRRGDWLPGSDAGR